MKSAPIAEIRGLRKPIPHGRPISGRIRKPFWQATFRRVALTAAIAGFAKKNRFASK